MAKDQVFGLTDRARAGGVTRMEAACQFARPRRRTSARPVVSEFALGCNDSFVRIPRYASGSLYSNNRLDRPANTSANQSFTEWWPT